MKFLLKIFSAVVLASVVFWFMGYNAVTSKYSVYASTVLNVDYNTTLLIAQGAAILSYLPVGLLSSKLGRKKMILGGVVILCLVGCEFFVQYTVKFRHAKKGGQA